MNLYQKTATALTLGLAFATGNAAAQTEAPQPQSQTITSNVIDMKPGQTMADIVAIAGNRPIITYAHANWCGWCRSLGPTLNETFAEHYPNNDAILVRIDVDKIRSYRSAGVPQLYVAKGATTIDKLMGFPNEGYRLDAAGRIQVRKPELKEYLNRFFSKADNFTPRPESQPRP